MNNPLEGQIVAGASPSPRAQRPRWRAPHRRSSSPLRGPQEDLSRARCTGGSPAGAGRWSFSPRPSSTACPGCRWNGRQAVLFDLAARKFYIFGARFLAAGLHLPHRAPGHLGAVAVPVHRRGRAAVVRLCLSADRLHRDLHVDRAQDRGRPRRAHDARPGADERAQVRPQGGQARRLDCDVAVDRIHVRRLLHADQGRSGARSPRSPPGPGRRSGSCSTASPPTAMPAGCASRCASTCAPTRASRARCSIRTR